MEMIYYTIAALVLYGISDFILNRIEIKIGKRLPNRSFIFLIIITILALVSFSVIRNVVDQPAATQQTTNSQVNSSGKEPVSTSPDQTSPTSGKTEN